MIISNDLNKFNAKKFNIVMFAKICFVYIDLHTTHCTKEISYWMTTEPKKQFSNNILI